MKVKILIEIRGGLIQEVTANGEVEVIVVDYDDLMDHEPSIMNAGVQEVTNSQFESTVKLIKGENNGQS